MSAAAFVTKDSGERQTFSTGMQRDSAAKELRPDLLPMAMVERWRKVRFNDDGLSTSELRRHAYDAFLFWLNDEGSFDAAAAVFAIIDMCEGDAAALEHPEREYLDGAMIVRWAELMGRGAIKYGERNWEKARTVEELARFKASAFRHFLQWYFGLNKEEDHAAAVYFNIAGAEYVKARLEEEEDNELRERARGILGRSSVIRAFDLVSVVPAKLEQALDVAKLEEAAAISPSWDPAVGDRVRITSSIDDGHFFGVEGELVEIRPTNWGTDWPYVVDTDGNKGTVWARDEIELVSGAQ